MDIREDQVITLDDGRKYYIFDNFENTGKNEKDEYLFAIGITKDWDLNSNDIIFLESTEENGERFVKEVPKNDPIYEHLVNIEAIRTRVETDPEYRSLLEKTIDNLPESSTE